MEEKISPLAAGILQGLNEAIVDAKGFEVEVYREQKISSPDKVLKKFITSSQKNLKAIN